MEKTSSRLKSLKTIGAVTKAMKAVSAARLAYAEKQISKIRVCGKAALAFNEKIEVFLPQTLKPKTLYVAVTSDRGLCGAINTEVCQMIKVDLQKEQSSDSSIICIGLTGTNILKYSHASYILLSVDHFSKTFPTFLDASEIAQHITKMEKDFNYGKIIYTEYVHKSSLRTRHLPIYNAVTLQVAVKFSYENTDLENIENYVGFSLAMVLFYAIRESYTSEQAARLKAMEIATHNIDNIHKKLSSVSSQTRQKAITTELIDVVVAAMSLKRKK